MSDNTEQRLSSLEKRMASMETNFAVSKRERIHMNQRFERVDEGLHKIYVHITKLVWLILASIIGAFMTVVIQGGPALG